MLRVVSHLAVELGGEKQVIAAVLDRLADDLLAGPVAVDVSGVDDGEAGVQRPKFIVPRASGETRTPVRPR
jgi:hypothetical protein